MKSLRTHFAQDRSGSVAVEFALLAPTLITMLLGIFQIGIGMHNYNALRSASADIARYAVVCYQTLNQTCNEDSEFESWARTRATASPYNLIGSRLTVNVDAVATPRVAGALEKTITLQYSVPSVLSMIGFNDIVLNYTRPVFLVS
jgi:Flp pilus assembly protein TadG